MPESTVSLSTQVSSESWANQSSSTAPSTTSRGIVRALLLARNNRTASRAHEPAPAPSPRLGGKGGATRGIPPPPSPTSGGMGPALPLARKNRTASGAHEPAPVH